MGRFEARSILSTSGTSALPPTLQVIDSLEGFHRLGEFDVWPDFASEVLGEEAEKTPEAPPYPHDRSVSKDTQAEPLNSGVQLTAPETRNPSRRTGDLVTFGLARGRDGTCFVSMNTTLTSHLSTSYPQDIHRLSPGSETLSREKLRTYGALFHEEH